MQMYTAEVETATKDLPPTDEAMDALAAYHPAVYPSDRGWSSARISLPAENAAQACATACAVVADALGAPVVAIAVMTEAETAAREGWVPLPDLVGVTEAAQSLGVTRQRVLQMIREGKLPASRVGNGWAIPATAIPAEKD